MTHAVRRLAGWACALDLADIPETVRHAAGNALVDTVAVAIAGSRTAVATRARRIARAAYGGGQASLLGTDETLNAPGAALANGAAAHALDFDDNCYAGFVHGSAVIMPAVLATAEAEGASGADLLTAFVAGCEAEFAAGAAATATLYEKGWWTTGVLGPVGASIAAAHVLGLDAELTACALGLAVAGTGGLKACFGTDGKPVLCGRAAESGVVAALMAGAGVTGPWNAFEDSRGFAALFNGGIFDADALEMLGSGWRILDPGIDIKRVPVCLSAHAALDAVMDLMAEHRIAAEEIGRVVCDVGPIVTANSRLRRPVDAAAGSVQHALRDRLHARARRCGTGADRAGKLGGSPSPRRHEAGRDGHDGALERLLRGGPALPRGRLCHDRDQGWTFVDPLQRLRPRDPCATALGR